METLSIDLIMKKINNLEKRIEQYFNYLRVQNELDFILNGSYIFEYDITKITEGTY